MSGCAAIEKNLAAFFDGELEGEAADEVVAHLEGCARCRARLDGLEEVDAPLRAIEPPPVAAREWGQCWGVIEAAIASEMPAAADTAPVAPPVPAPLKLVVPDAAADLPARAAARLVRFLIPLAAAASIALAAYGATIVSAHANASPADEVALVGLAPAGDNP